MKSQFDGAKVLRCWTFSLPLFITILRPGNVVKSTVRRDKTISCDNLPFCSDWTTSNNHFSTQCELWIVSILHNVQDLLQSPMQSNLQRLVNFYGSEMSNILMENNPATLSQSHFYFVCNLGSDIETKLQFLWDTKHFQDSTKWKIK